MTEITAFYAYGKRWPERRGILLPGSTLAWVKALGGVKRSRLPTAQLSTRPKTPTKCC